MKTLALLARVFIHCFLVFGYPGETLALVVHILLYIPHTVMCIAIQPGVLKCLNEVYSVAAPQISKPSTVEHIIDGRTHH